MRKGFIIIGIVFLVGLSYLLYQWATFEIFPVETQLLQEYTLDDKIYRVYYTGGNATTEEVIQLKIKRQGYEYLVKAIEGYNSLQGLKILNDSTVQLILLDDNYQSNKPDTLEIISK